MRLRLRICTLNSNTHAQARVHKHGHLLSTDSELIHLVSVLAHVFRGKKANNVPLH